MERCKSIVMVPWLAHGHISPFFELAKKLAKRNFNIYLCSTSINLNSIRKRLIASQPISIQLVELHLPSFLDLPPHYHTTNGLPTNLMGTLKTAFDMAAPSFSLILENLKPDFVIYDFNQPWAASIASSRNIPAVQFLTFGACFVSFIFHMVNNPSGEFPFPSIYLSEPERVIIRGTLEFSVNGVKDGDRVLEAVNKSCNIILIKSFREIDGKYLDYLSSMLGKKMVPVGPLVYDPTLEEDEHIEIIKWLDNKDESSTAFVSFGTEYFLSKKEIEEIAYGLELSNVNFIWVIRFPEGEKMKVEMALPKGFLQRVGQRGLVVEWAPQTKILGHQNIGGFVSHCGWSSVVESAKFGVPIIAMPMHIDQPVNARLVVEVGAGLEVKRDKNGVFQGEEIASVVKKVIVERDGETIRSRAKEMSESMRMKGEEEVDCVIEELMQLC